MVSGVREIVCSVTACSPSAIQRKGKGGDFKQLSCCLAEEPQDPKPEKTLTKGIVYYANKPRSTWTRYRHPQGATCSGKSGTVGSG